MAIPDFIVALRQHIGSAPLWLSGATAAVVRQAEAGEEWLFVRRADTGCWSLVTGIIDPGEHPGDAAVREVLEEAGVVAEVVRLVWLDVTPPVIYDNGDVTQYLNLTFRCRWLAGEPHPSDGENTDARFFPLDALPPLPDDHAALLRVVLADAAECGLGPVP